MKTPRWTPALLCAATLAVASCSPSKGLTGQHSTTYTSKYGYEITLTAPNSGGRASTPLKVSGEVRGSWGYLGAFPIEVVDSSHKTLAKADAKFHGNWMEQKEEPLRFTASVPFKAPATDTGFLILRKANPADDRAMNDSLRIPIKF